MSATQNQNRIGLGLYSIPDAARIIGSRPGLIRRWAKQSEGLVPRVFGEEEMITFTELMELHFIKMFRDQGVSLQTIRKASGKAAERFHTSCPFSVKRFDTDGKAIFATMQQETSDEEVLLDVIKGQFVFETVMRPFFRKLEYGQNFDLLRFWPLSKKGRVVLDPARKFGKPIDAETGVPTKVIVDALNAGGGQSPAVVARWLDIPIAAVNKAAEFERSQSV